MSALNALQPPPTGLQGSEAALKSARLAAVGNLLTGKRQGRDALNQAQGGALDSVNRGTSAGVGALNPFAQAGQGAGALQAALLGASGAGAQAQALQDFQNSPGQAFLRDRGEQALLRNASATGGLGGGNVLAELNRQGIGFANQSFNDRISQLQGLTGQGLQAAGQIGSLQDQLGRSRADILGGTASQIASGAASTGSQLANIFGGTGSQLSQGRTGAGNAIANAISGTTQGLSDLANQQGQGLSNLTGEQASNLANILQSSGMMQGQGMDQLATLLANIATGSGSQVAGLPSIPGVQETSGALGGLGQLAGGIGGLMTGIRTPR